MPSHDAMLLMYVHLNTFFLRATGTMEITIETNIKHIIRIFFDNFPNSEKNSSVFFQFLDKMIENNNIFSKLLLIFFANFGSNIGKFQNFDTFPIKHASIFEYVNRILPD